METMLLVHDHAEAVLQLLPCSYISSFHPLILQNMLSSYFRHPASYTI